MTMGHHHGWVERCWPAARYSAGLHVPDAISPTTTSTIGIPPG